MARITLTIAVLDENDSPSDDLADADGFIYSSRRAGWQDQRRPHPKLESDKSLESIKTLWLQWMFFSFLISSVCFWIISLIIQLAR